MWRVLLAVVLACGIARADERDDAKREFAAGQASDKQRDFRGAIEHYLRAFELVPHPYALFNIAADYEQIGDLRQAVHFYEKYIAVSEDGSDRDRVKKLLADIKARPAGLVVHTQPEGATLTIDGKPVGATPYSGQARGGRHMLVVELDGQRSSKEIDIQFGEPVTETIRLEGKSGTIEVAGSPFGAEVAIDNVPVGVIPVAVPEPPGEHAIRVTMAGHTPFETTALVQPGATTRVNAMLVKGSETGGGSPLHGILVYYLVGATGGADARGDGGYYAFELGMHATQYDLLVTLGKTSVGGNVEFLFRYFPLKTRLAPFIGGGYSYVQGGAGYGLQAGLRFDLTRGDRLGASLLATYDLRVYAGTDANADNMTMAREPGVFMPISAALELYWR